MSSNEIQNIESSLDELLASNNYREYALEFGKLVVLKEECSFYKAAALLYFLAEHKEKDYYRLQQTITVKELSDDYIQLVMAVGDIVLRGEIGSLDQIISSADSRITGLLELLKKRMEDTNKQVLETDISIKRSTYEEQKEMQNIADCLFVAKNFYGN